MILVFLSLERVLDLHEQLIARFGGATGLRDAGLLESAVMRAENKTFYDPQASLASVAASLGWGIVKNHAFVDGNKRTGLAAMVALLAVNGYGLIAEQADQADVIQRVASGEMNEEALAAWVERRLQRE